MAPQQHHVDNIEILDRDILEQEYDIWRKLPSPTPPDLRETYPEALPIVQQNLKIYKKLYKESEPLYNELLEQLMILVYSNNDLPKEGYKDEKGFYVAGKNDGIKFVTRRFYKDPVESIERHIKRLEHLVSLYTYKGGENANSVTPQDIQAARNIPIGSFVQVNRSGFCKCPFHNEGTPSCKIFPDNKFRCFGCDANGDVIDIVMKQNDLPFLDAVKFLLKR
jgi:hypothetical protein